MTQSTFALALTFDDVLLVPQASAVAPRMAQVATELGPRLSLQVPLLSAAMDTVTESSMAMAMAREGGLGIVHKNLSIEAQVREVLRVKKSESGMIIDPVTISPDASLAEAQALMRRHQISGIPVVVEGMLVGIVTHRDLRFVSEPQSLVRTVMTREVITADENIDSESSKALLQRHRIEKLPVVDAAGRLCGLITIKDIEKSARHPHATKDARGRLRVGAAVGVGEDRAARCRALVAAGVDLLNLDTAHGHSTAVLAAVTATRAEHPGVTLMAGNVATGAATQALLAAGADVVKVGVGPGSICTTRVVAGVGVPQFSAILDCAAAARARGGCIVADGGVRNSGDLVKALAAGAAAVMVGSMLAGTDEAPGEVVLYQGRAYKTYRGMGSLGAMQAGSAERYFQDPAEQSQKLVPEGVEGLVPCKGSLSASVYQLVGGLRSGMGYLGAIDLSALIARAEFVQISAAGMRESHVHDVTVTKEPPNYRV